jgi:hypothetical protein
MTDYALDAQKRANSTAKLIETLGWDNTYAVIAWLEEQTYFTDIRFADARSVRRNTLLWLDDDLFSQVNDPAYVPPN